jgi:uncharacterized repeat protein (TIGR01451 family)
MKSIRICSVLVFCLLAFVTSAVAKPQVEIKIVAEKEMTVIKNGQKSTKMVPVKKIATGEIIQYTLSYKNSGKEAARDVVINDPIPEGTTYIAGSASEKGKLTFSIDGGKTFNSAPLVTYEAVVDGNKKEKRVAGTEQYTHIRWIIDRVEPGASDKVSFKVKVK